MEKELNLNIAKLNGDTLTILHGKATEEVFPEKIFISGDIKTLANFLSVRKQAGSGVQAIDASKAIVLVDKKDLKIELHLDPESKYCVKVVSKLEESDELIEFGINETKFFTKDSLVQLVKFNRIFFEESDKYNKLLAELRKTSSSVNILANDSKDERGNKAREFVKTVTTNVPTEFTLNIPVFKGFPPKVFRVEICLDVKEGNAEYWLESTDLHELKQLEVESIFEEQLKSAEGFVIINQ